MPPTIGCDIVHIPRIIALLSNPTALDRIFSKSELENRDPAHLAGIFAVKESVFKAIGAPPKWKDVEVASLKSGKPLATLSQAYQFDIIDISISHDGDYAVAMVFLSTRQDYKK